VGVSSHGLSQGSLQRVTGVVGEPYGGDDTKRNSKHAKPLSRHLLICLTFSMAYECVKCANMAQFMNTPGPL
jgi:hypothetical protein